MKRDVLFDATKKIARVRDTLSSLQSAYETYGKHNQKDLDETHATGAILAATTKYSESANELDQMVPLVFLVCGAEINSTMMKLVVTSREIAQKAMNGEHASSEELTKQTVDLTWKRREEMGIQARSLAVPSTVSGNS